MNDAAIVTGASSGIGLEISKMLCRRGYEVFGIGRNFDPAHESDHFHPIVCDILDTDNLCDTVKNCGTVSLIGTRQQCRHRLLWPA